MAEPENGNGEVKRWQAYWGMAKEAITFVGVPLVLLSVFLTVAMGWVESPVLNAASAIQEIKRVITEHAGHDEERAHYAHQECIAIHKLAKLNPRECDWVHPK